MDPLLTGMINPAIDRRAIRIFLTVFVVYAAFLTSNVARETYLAVAIGDRLSPRVDPFLGLHPDLFEIPGRGAYINSNPGASILGAIPYALSRPLVAGIFALKPELGAPKPPTGYDDPRPNRSRLMNEMRARGLDVRLALAAFATQLGLMAPAGASAAVAMYLYLLANGRPRRVATGLALLYALGTPIFFRSAFLNQNLLLAHVVMATWMVLTWPTTDAPGSDRHRRWFAAGALLGLGLLIDYSAAPLAVVFGGWALREGWSAAGVAEALRRAATCVAGAAIPVMVLLGYQWYAFGVPWYPAQRYMPDTALSVVGWNGVSLPSAELLWRNLIDPRYGLFAFCPMLILALAALTRPAWRRGPSVGVALAASLALWVFSSANHFAFLQWNTGVRYLVPVVPLLFLAMVPVLLAMRPWARAAVVIPTVAISFAVSMTREDVPTALRVVAAEGPVLPLVIVLNKTAAAYAPMLGAGIQPWGIAAVGLLGLVVLMVWRWNGRRPALGDFRYSPAQPIPPVSQPAARDQDRPT